VNTVGKDYNYVVSYKSVRYDRPGESSTEKDCLRWHCMTFQ